ncbi:hypothetical protein DSBG_2515 [Desulfosporosinus sp. BG]|nr:hypothetical protein DSBG_2515 [Desulfosporosinus sp. BG]
MREVRTRIIKEDQGLRDKVCIIPNITLISNFNYSKHNG